jgi:hypothetical protein
LQFRPALPKLRLFCHFTQLFRYGSFGASPADKPFCTAACGNYRQKPYFYRQMLPALPQLGR